MTSSHQLKLIRGYKKCPDVKDNKKIKKITRNKEQRIIKRQQIDTIFCGRLNLRTMRQVKILIFIVSVVKRIVPVDSCSCAHIQLNVESILHRTTSYELKYWTVYHSFGLSSALGLFIYFNFEELTSNHM